MRALLLLVLSPTALPATQTPAPAAGEVTVTGRRPLVLTVDFNEIWKKCVACRIEQSRLRQTVRTPMRGATQAGSSMTYAPDLQQQEALAKGGGEATVGYYRESAKASIVTRYFGPSQKVVKAARDRALYETADFRTRLGIKVTELAEAQQQATGAATIQRRNDPVPRGARTVDITQQLIAALDSDPSFTATPPPQPSIPAPAKRRR